jgi:ubiquinone/menaquinone biosynthesis C-methylase UbiE
MIRFLKKKFLKNFNSNYLDLITPNEFEFKDSHYKKTLELWGKGNHNNNKSKYDGNETHIEKLIETFGSEDFNKNSYLEIGCGEGIDLNYVVKNFKIKDLFATDIGENIKGLSKREKFKNIKFIRCDCLNLPFENDSFDQIYSYGVFHHTKDFNKALLESKRVLKKHGVLIFYTYKKHDNTFKKVFIFFEGILLKVFSTLNYKYTKFLCYLISPLILLLFSYPAQILKFLNFNKTYKKIPLWWGTSPRNIIHDLTDRLYAPINIRYSSDELKEILENLKFSEISVVNVRDGLFCRVVK